MLIAANPMRGAGAQSETCAKYTYARLMSVSMILSKARRKKKGSMRAKDRVSVRTLCVREPISIFESLDTVDLMKIVDWETGTRSAMDSHNRYSGISHTVPRSSGGLPQPWTSDLTVLSV